MAQTLTKIASGDHPSRKRFRHQIPSHIGQPEVTSLELEGQPFMVHTQAMQDSGLQIVHVHRVGNHVIAVVVGLADRDAALDPATGHPHAEAARMMVPAVVGFGELALAIHRAAEFAPR